MSEIMFVVDGVCVCDIFRNFVDSIWVCFKVIYVCL